MAKTLDLRQLKDNAARAVEKRNYAKAAECYVEIALFETDPDWRQRAGEAFRKSGKTKEAIDQFVLAAEGYAQGGFFLKAVAVCKIVLQLDAAHTGTQQMLAKLYADREPRTKPPVSDSLELTAPVEMVRTYDGNFALLDGTPTPVVPEIAARSRKKSSPATLLAGSPIDEIPLADVIGGQRSQEFRLTTDVDEGSGIAYEIFLDDIAAEQPASPERSIEDTPTAPYLTDFGPRQELTPLPRNPESQPEIRLAALPETAFVVTGSPVLPQIPLFSSLNTDELIAVIEGVKLLDVEPGHTVLRQGELGVALYVIVRGHVDVLVEGFAPNQEPLLVASLADGEFFGELALLTDSPRSATVIAREPTQLLEISRDLIATVVSESPEVLRVLLRFFRDRMVDRLLRTSRLFSRFNLEDASQLVNRFRFLEVDPDVVVVPQGERAPGLFLLLCGDVRVEQGRRTLATLRPGDVVGEMSLLTRSPAVASVKTHAKSWLLELPSKDFQEIMLSFPQLLEYVSEIAESRQMENRRGPEGRVEFL